jgi:hypothetical protein
MRWFVRAAALYNLVGGATLVIPGSLGLVGVATPYSSFWLWLPALLGSFGAIVLFLSSSDLVRYGSFVYWNALVRLAWVVVTFALGFPASVGWFAAALAVGDLVLAIGCLVGVPITSRRSHRDLLTNQLAVASHPG